MENTSMTGSCRRGASGVQLEPPPIPRRNLNSCTLNGIRANNQNSLASPPGQAGMAAQPSIHTYPPRDWRKLSSRSAWTKRSYSCMRKCFGRDRFGREQRRISTRNDSRTAKGIALKAELVTVIKLCIDCAVIKPKLGSILRRIHSWSTGQTISRTKKSCLHVGSMTIKLLLKDNRSNLLTKSSTWSTYVCIAVPRNDVTYTPCA